MMSFLSKSELGFWTYGLMSALGPGGPKLVFKPQTLRLRYLLGLENFIKFNL